MENKTQFPDLTKHLKVGDSFHSFMYGEGKVVRINDESYIYPIEVYFKNTEDVVSLTKNGMVHLNLLFPSIHLNEWNPLVEPFPMPKFTPVVGEAYAFFDDIQKGYLVGILTEITNYYYVVGIRWEYCLPIEEAHAKYMDYLKSQK